MRVLFDVTHPAQVHFFKELIWKLQREGHETLVATREKDVAVPLLAGLKIPYRCLTRKGDGMIGMGRELLARYVGILNLARQFRPHVMLAQTGVSIGLVGALLHIPRLVLEEAEHAKLQQMLGLPFATRIFTGIGYTKSFGPRQVHFRGVWVQSYLHPNYYRPSTKPLIDAGIDPSQPYIVLRTVSWSAAHDRGLRGLTEAQLHDVVHRLQRFGRVVISAEGELPASLRELRNPVAVHHVHDLLAHAKLYIGEGGTMAAEAAVLGTPAVFCNHLRVGYLVALEKDFGLAFNTNSLLEGLPVAESLLARPHLAEEWRTKHERLMEQTEDITEFMHNLIVQSIPASALRPAPLREKL